MLVDDDDAAVLGANKDFNAQAAKLGIQQVLEKPLAAGALVAAIRSALKPLTAA